MRKPTRLSETRRGDVRGWPPSAGNLKLYLNPVVSFNAPSATYPDSSGNNAAANLSGTSWNESTGRRALNSSGGYCLFSDSAALSPTAQITIAQWIRPTANGAAGNTTCTLFKGDISVLSPQSYGFLWLNTGEINFRWANGSALDGITPGSSPLNTWTHWCCTFASGVVRCYRDGFYLTGKTSTVTSLQDNSSPLAIGSGLITGAGNSPFPGYIGITLIYDRALSDGEVYDLYRRW